MTRVRDMRQIECQCSCADECPQGRAGTQTKCRINIAGNSVKNPSGISPTEYKVLIAAIEVTDKIGSIFIPDEHIDRVNFAQQEGVLIALAPLAFTYDKWEGIEDMKPKVGDKVLFAKFAGFEHKGKDGKKYRVVNDKDVSAVLA